MKYIIDTNVPIVANGVPTKIGEAPPSDNCRKAAIEFLIKIVSRGKIITDIDGEVEEEYRKYLSPCGQPGVGDRFYLEVINSSPNLVERIKIEKDNNGEYIDLHFEITQSKFDLSDRKFAALSCKSGGTVINTTDSDWILHQIILTRNGVKIRNICGTNKADWFSASKIDGAASRG